LVRREVTLDPSITSIQATFELGSGTSADFDDIAIVAGPCADAYAGVDQHQVCSVIRRCAAATARAGRR